MEIGSSICPDYIATTAQSIDLNSRLILAKSKMVHHKSKLVTRVTGRKPLPIASKVRDLGSYANFSLGECLNDKLGLLVKDEADLPRPVVISLCIPTKIDATKETRDLEMTVMKRAMSQCSQLVDLGYLDEIIVIDGSTDDKGKADYSTLEKVVETAFDELDLFKRQVRLIDENKAVASNAKQGFFDFIVKAVHQFDPNMSHVLDRYGTYSVAALDRIPAGKGAALWLSIPLSKGDIVCFVDSDIMNFTKEFVVALCHPILRDMHETETIRMVKAYYRRLTVSFEPLGGKYMFGGRVTRLFMIPILKVLADEFPEIFDGLESLRYPLSGEFAATRELLESLRFPSDYSIEFSILKQVAANIGLGSVGQVDLEIFHHIGQSEVGLDKMVGQIADQILRTIKEGGISLSTEERRGVVARYEKEAGSTLSSYQTILREMADSISKDLNVSVAYSEKEETEKSERFKKILDEVMFKASPVARTILPSWVDVARGANYFATSILLRRRANQSTFSRLAQTGLFYSL